MSNRRLYWIWWEMKARCEKPSHRFYYNYGGRGIYVSPEWRSFHTFADDMGEKPDGCSLDRIDNDGPYSRDNCRWDTRKQQNSNRRSCIYVQHGFERVTLKEYCRREGLRYRAIVKRIQDRGWPLELALSVPVGSTTHKLKKLQPTRAAA